MKDLHCHILPGLDDGCVDIEESIKILKEAEKAGVTDIMFTPHFHKLKGYTCDNEKKLEVFSNLEKRVKEENINIKLYLGNEILIDPDMVGLITSGKVRTLNNQNYLLFEFDTKIEHYPGCEDVLYNLVLAGCTPIMAHPERYKYFQKHPEAAEKYAKLGILFQGNYKSLLGKYGRGSEKTLKTFLKKGLITFLASDIHHESNYDLEKAKKKVKSIVKDDSVIDDLFINNFDKVVNNEPISMKRR